METSTGELQYTLGDRKNNGLFRDLLAMRDPTSPTSRIDRMYVGVDHYIIHKAKAVHQWLEKHPRCELLWLPTYCPKANPIERTFGDVHDKGTRNHQRKRLRDGVQDVEQHLKTNGPWKYKISRLYDEPDVLAEVERLVAQQPPRAAA